jgi:hypothetical protein
MEMKKNSCAAAAILALAFTVSPASALPDRVGIFKPARSMFYEDVNGNLRWDGNANGDHVYMFFDCCWDLNMRPLTGDWNGDGYDDMGVMYPHPSGQYSYSLWSLDSNGNNHFVAGPDLSMGWGTKSDRPFSGDWNGNGRDTIGAFRPATARFILLDESQNTIRVTVFGEGSDLPVAGDWNGDGVDEIGVFRPRANGFFLDTNGNGTLEVTDRFVAFGLNGDLPIIGDWNDDGCDDVGVWRASNTRYYLDANGSGVWDTGDVSALWGAPGELPIAGKWKP